MAEKAGFCDIQSSFVDIEVPAIGDDVLAEVPSGLEVNFEGSSIVEKSGFSPDLGGEGLGLAGSNV